LQQTSPDILNTAAESLRQLSQVDDTEDLHLQELRQALGDTEDNVLAMLGQHASAIEKDIVDAKQRLDACRREVEAIWSDDYENEYELSSVFIHLGAAGYGHYYRESALLVQCATSTLLKTLISGIVYQRALPHQPERWLKFNDESVRSFRVFRVDPLYLGRQR
jgi:hypothetical protein